MKIVTVPNGKSKFRLKVSAVCYTEQSFAQDLGNLRLAQPVYYLIVLVCRAEGPAISQSLRKKDETRRRTETAQTSRDTQLFGRGRVIRWALSTSRAPGRGLVFHTTLPSLAVNDFRLLLFTYIRPSPLLGPSLLSPLS